MNKTRPIMFSFVILCALALSSCSEVYVTNLTELNVRVSVNTPDSGSPSTRLVRPVEIESVFSSNGGRYSVTVLPDENYRELLEGLQRDISRKLFDEGATLSAADVSQLTQRMNEIDQALEALQGQAGASCSGFVPDFESVTVYVTWNAAASQFILECGSGSSE